MRKATTTLLAAAMIFAMAGGRVAQAADRAGIGLEWAYNPTINLSGFDIDLSGQEFALAWKVSDSFSVAVYRGSGNYSISHEYTDDLTYLASGQTVKVKEVLEGSVGTSGIRFLTTLPMLTFLSLGLEAGAVTLGGVTGGGSFTRSDGSGAADTDFGPAGVAGSYGGATYGTIGVVGKITLLKGEVKTVGTELSVGGSLKFVPIADNPNFTGVQEVTVNKPAGQKKAIDPIESFNTLTLAATVALTF